MTVIDHLVYAVPDLTVAVERFEAATGVRPAIGGAHVGMGTHNALVSFGPAYLELIAPDPSQPEPAQPRPFGIDDLRDAALVAFAVRPADGASIDDVVAAARANGYDPGEIVAMSRATPSGALLEWRLTFPRMEFGGVVPFVIDWGSTERPSDTQPGGVELTTFSLAAPAAEDVAAHLTALGIEQRVGDADVPGLSATVAGPGGDLSL